MSKFSVQFFTGDYVARQQAANSAKAIVYVEQHFNSHSNPQGRGVEVVVASNASDKSKEVGTSYAKGISKALDIPIRNAPSGLVIGGYEGRGNANLKYTAMPAVLLETCYASNPAEAAMIRDPFSQRVMATTLADVIRQQFPGGGLVAFSVGHRWKTSNPEDRGAEVLGGGFEAEYAQIVLQMAAAQLSEQETVEMPEPVAKPSLRQMMGRAVVNFEARRDKRGHLAVYPLPSGDGGGTYEVAGINDRYHPEMSNKLRTLIQNSQFEEAEEAAAEYIMKYTDHAADCMIFDGHDLGDRYPQVEFYIRDCAFNRGPRGAACILQRALSVTVDGSIGGFTKAALLEQLEESPDELLDRLRTARDWYERKYAGRDEHSKFWKGLVNRWDNALTAARALV